MASSAGRAFFSRASRRDVFQVLAWVPVGIFITRHVYSLATITGASMQPTFNPDISCSPLHHDVVLLERWSIALNKYQRGDVVTLWSPQNPDLLTTKRIVALEGDLVHPLPPHSPTPVRIPPGHCWVEGDSQFQTRDSNTYGPVRPIVSTCHVLKLEPTSLRRENGPCQVTEGVAHGTGTPETS